MYKDIVHDPVPKGTLKRPSDPRPLEISATKEGKKNGKKKKGAILQQK